ncbi:MAG: hypothetical protein U9Q33_04765 [Campylobacterota bacterium]|nr:hypothetical protein [Campylobacterota bacterium]
MGKSYEKKINNIKTDLKEIFEILIKDNKMIVDIIQDCSKQNVKAAKKALNSDNITAVIEKIDKTILDHLALKEIDKKNIKILAKYLKVNSDILKISKNTRVVVSKLDLCCKDIEDKNIKKYVLKIYNNIIKVLNILVEVLEFDDEDEISDSYDNIVILDSKIDSIYEDINKYILKETDKKNHYRDIMILIRKTEKISSRAVSIASLIKFDC